MLFPPVHACYKNLQHRSKHNPIIWAWRNKAKLNFLSDIHWLNDIEPLIALFSFSLCMCNMFCFLWPIWMKFLRYAYIYIYHIDEILQQHRWHIYDILMQQRWFHATAVGRRDRQQWRKHFQGKTTPIDRRYNKQNHQKKQKKQRSSNYEPPNLSLESLFFLVFFCFSRFFRFSVMEFNFV